MILKTEQLGHIREVERICVDAGDTFPTVSQLDAMLDELRYLPRTPRCAELSDLLLDIRWDLTGAPS